MNKCSNPQCGCDACDCGDTKIKKEQTEVDNCTCENACHCSKESLHKEKLHKKSY